MVVCLVKHSYPEVGALETWYAPETWLACFLLATTVTEVEDLTATGENCNSISTIFTNPVFCPHYGVWTSTAPLFGRMEGSDSSFCNVKGGIVFGLPF